MFQTRVYLIFEMSEAVLPSGLKRHSHTRRWIYYWGS